MNRLSRTMSAVLLTSATGAVAASDFDGTWKYDIKTQEVSKKPNVYLLKGGSYTCSTCVPAYTVAADGSFHKVAGNPYYDEVAVKAVDPSTMTWVSRKGGKTMVEVTRVASPDGKTSMTSFNDMTAPNGVPVVGKAGASRVAAGPAGSHATSGSWVDTTDGEVSDAGLLITMRSAGDVMTLTTPTGISYTTTIDGPPSPVVGDPGWTKVALKRTAANTLVETDYRGDTVTGVYTFALSPDGKSIRADANDLLHGTKSAATLLKQ